MSKQYLNQADLQEIAAGRKPMPENSRNTRKENSRNLAKAKPRKEPGRMNDTEFRYSAHLEQRKIAGEIYTYGYEPIKLRLADKTFYTPDFMVVLADMTIEFHEVKGSWKAPHQDDARVKIKVAAEQFPLFRFVAAVKVKGEWQIERFG